MILLAAFRLLASEHKRNLGLTDLDLAQACGVSQPTLSKWLREGTTGADLGQLEMALCRLGGWIEVVRRNPNGGPLELVAGNVPVDTH